MRLVRYFTIFGLRSHFFAATTFFIVISLLFQVSALTAATVKNIKNKLLAKYQDAFLIGFNIFLTSFFILFLFILKKCSTKH